MGEDRTVLPSRKVTEPWALTRSAVAALRTIALSVAAWFRAEGVGVTETVVVVAGSVEVPMVRHQPLVIWRTPAAPTPRPLTAKRDQVPLGDAPPKVLAKVAAPKGAALL